MATRPGSTATCGERELVTPQAATGKLVTPQAARQWSRLRRPRGNWSRLRRPESGHASGGHGETGHASGGQKVVTPQAATGKLVTPQAARQWSRLRRPGTSCGELGHVCRRPAHRLCESMGSAKYSDILFDTYGAHWLHKTQAILRIVVGRPTASRLAACL